MQLLGISAAGICFDEDRLKRMKNQSRQMAPKDTTRRFVHKVKIPIQGDRLRLVPRRGGSSKITYFARILC